VDAAADQIKERFGAGFCGEAARWAVVGSPDQTEDGSLGTPWGSLPRRSPTTTAARFRRPHRPQRAQ
jgi:hypothetical protein